MHLETRRTCWCNPRWCTGTPGSSSPPVNKTVFCWKHVLHGDRTRKAYLLLWIGILKCMHHFESVPVKGPLDKLAVLKVLFLPPQPARIMLDMRWRGEARPPKKYLETCWCDCFKNIQEKFLEKCLFILCPLQFMTNFAFRTLVSEKENASHLTVTARSWLWELTKSNEASWVLFYQLNHFLVYRLFLLQRGTQDTFHQLNFLSDKV